MQHLLSIVQVIVGIAICLALVYQINQTKISHNYFRMAMLDTIPSRWVGLKQAFVVVHGNALLMQYHH